MKVSASAVVQNLVTLVKYAVLLIILVVAAKFLFRDSCRVASEDPGMRPAIGSTRTLLSSDRDAWTEADFEVGDIALAYMESGEKDARAFPFRVVAVGGQWIRLESGLVFHCADANDKHGTKESYAGADIKGSSSLQPVPTFQVPRGYLYLLSDNRVDRAAADDPGLVPASRVLGKVRL